LYYGANDENCFGVPCIKISSFCNCDQIYDNCKLTPAPPTTMPSEIIKSSTSSTQQLTTIQLQSTLTTTTKTNIQSTTKGPKGKFELFYQKRMIN
jgi:hypothetical protein